MKPIVASLLGAILAIAGITPTPARAQGTPTSTSSMSLIDQSVVVAPDGDFTVLALATGAAEATDFAVDIYDRVPEDEPIGPVPDRDPEATFGPAELNPPDAAGDRTFGFTIRLYRDGEANPDPQWGHEIDEPGVYPVRIRLRGPDGTQAVLMTTLLRLPDPDQLQPPATAALLVDVDAPPPSDPDDRRSTTAADPTLIEDLTPVLAALDERPELAATFSATPDTVARLAADEDSAPLLSALRVALDGSQRTLLDASYVDVDPTDLVANGIGSELEVQRDAGTQTLVDLLEPPPRRTWRLRDRIDRPALDALAAYGVSSLVLPDEAVDGDAGSFAPVSLATGVGATTAAVTSDALTVGLAAPDDPVLDAHRLLARLATRPGSRSIVAVDPSTADPEDLRVLFDALAIGTPFFTATTVEVLLDAVQRPEALAAATAPSDLDPYPKAVTDARAGLRSYAAMVADEPERTAPLERNLLVSASRDLSVDQATADARSVTRALREPFGAISTPPRDTVTLGARDATFPITIESALDYPVRVTIELQSSDRVEFPADRTEQVLEPGRQEIDIRVRTRTTGDTPVRISVRTPDDGVLLTESRYTIRSTAVSGVGVILTVGAAAFLALWWGRHWYRHRGQARHARRRGRRAPSV